jgi:hypothetical protein
MPSGVCAEAIFKPDSVENRRAQNTRNFFVCNLIFVLMGGD